MNEFELKATSRELQNSFFSLFPKVRAALSGQQAASSQKQQHASMRGFGPFCYSLSHSLPLYPNSILLLVLRHDSVFSFLFSMAAKIKRARSTRHP
jgi:hypothetical protein